MLCQGVGRLLPVLFILFVFSCSQFVRPSDARSHNTDSAPSADIPATADAGATNAGRGLASGSDEADVLAIFKAECFSCHGDGGINQGAVGSILDLSALVEKKLVIKKDLKASRLYQRMTSVANPMPPKGRISDDRIKVVEDWIMEVRKVPTRTQIVYGDVFKQIEADYKTQQEPLNTRYLQLVHMYNSGAPDEDIESARKGITKMLNMLSSTKTIVNPVAIDKLKLIYRVNLRDYDLESPETLYTKFLRNTFPVLTDAQKSKYVAPDQERVPEKTYGGRWKEIFEAKPVNSAFLDAAKQTFPKGFPLPNHPQLQAMVANLRETGTDSAGKVGTSRPIPIMRGDWFIARVSSDMGMRLYYNLAGYHPTTVELDTALGIDDVEGLMADNDPAFDPVAWGKKKIIRAGFNNSGVSINHRMIERVPLDFVDGHPLWRGYEFKPALENPLHNLFKLPLGPFFEPAIDGNVGFECVNVLTKPFDAQGNRTLALLDGKRFYPSKPSDGKEPSIVTSLKAETDPIKKEVLLVDFEKDYGHRDFVNYLTKPTNSTKITCEKPADLPAFRHDGFEYQFLRANGLQGFLNVNQFADLLDYKIPNQRAFENKDVVVIPAFDRPDVPVVGAPLSCLSCHARGFIDKRDMINEYVQGNNFADLVKAKVSRLYRPHDEFNALINQDNKILIAALNKMGIAETDPEPVTTVYKRWALPGLTLPNVAAEMYMTPDELKKFIVKDPRANEILGELLVSGSTIKRSTLEKTYEELMCLANANCN